MMDSPGPRTNIEIFHTLENPESRTNAFGVSLVAHLALLAVIFALPLLFTDPLNLTYVMTQLAPPLIEPPAPVKVYWNEPAPAPIEQQAQEPLITTPPPPPKIEAPKPEPIEIAARIPAVVTPAPSLEEAPAPAPPPPPKPSAPVFTEPRVIPSAPPVRDMVRTNVFSSEAGNGEKQPSARNVQTGGFGASQGRSSTTTGARTVSKSGFGAVDRAASAATVDRQVRTSGFANTEIAPAEAAPAKKPVEAPAVPAEILFKPRPEYTEDARKLRIEGEVVLRVRFSATGEVQVIEVIRGLGHGLDENAIRAAQRIRFKPAQRDRQPIDSTAIVHIVFQLAG